MPHFGLVLELPDWEALAGRLRARPDTAAVRLIAITGMPEAESRDRALASGCEAIYRKPLDPAVLEALLDEGRKE